MLPEGQAEVTTSTRNALTMDDTQLLLDTNPPYHPKVFTHNPLHHHHHHYQTHLLTLFTFTFGGGLIGDTDPASGVEYFFGPGPAGLKEPFLRFLAGGGVKVLGLGGPRLGLDGVVAATAGARGGFLDLAMVLAVFLVDLEALEVLETDLLDFRLRVVRCARIESGSGE